MTIIVEKGKFKIGNLIIIDDILFKIKTMKNDRGKNIETVYPGDAVQIKGIPKIPNPGDELLVV